MRFFNIFLLLISSSSFFSLKTIKHLHTDVRLHSKKDKIKSLNNFCAQTYTPKGENQEKYVNYLNNNTVDIVVSVGPAGTGKTLLACLKAIDLLKSGKARKVVITRPIVAVEEEELGFLPGNLVKKMDPWTRPIMDIFLEHYSKTEMDNMIFNNIIEKAPLAYMRGRTFKNAFIIADEMQNSTPNQMLMLTTRIGLNSKLIITGDLKQTDRSNSNNGLYDLIDKVNTYKKSNNIQNIEIIEFEKSDVERSQIVKTILDIYESKKEGKFKEYELDAALIPLDRQPKFPFNYNRGGL